MKTLEEVMKQKCKFIGNSKKPYELYNLEPYSYTVTDILLFITNDNLESKNIITLLEEMTPLLTYIFSCIAYKSSFDLRELHLNLKFPIVEFPIPGCYLTLHKYIYKIQSTHDVRLAMDRPNYNYKKPLFIIKENTGIKSSRAYYIFFIQLSNKNNF